MYLYNSATHRKEEFVPNHPDIVKMYTCGPTVYHFAHIGNLRSYIMEDVLDLVGVAADLLAAHPDDLGRHAHGGGVGRHVLEHHRPGGDPGPVRVPVGPVLDRHRDPSRRGHRPPAGH